MNALLIIGLILLSLSNFATSTCTSAIDCHGYTCVIDPSPPGNPAEHLGYCECPSYRYESDGRSSQSVDEADRTCSDSLSSIDQSLYVGYRALSLIVWSIVVLCSLRLMRNLWIMQSIDQSLSQSKYLISIVVLLVGCVTKIAYLSVDPLMDDGLINLSSYSTVNQSFDDVWSFLSDCLCLISFVSLIDHFKSQCLMSPMISDAMYNQFVKSNHESINRSLVAVVLIIHIVSSFVPIIRPLFFAVFIVQSINQSICQTIKFIPIARADRKAIRRISVLYNGNQVAIHSIDQQPKTNDQIYDHAIDQTTIIKQSSMSSFNPLTSPVSMPSDNMSQNQMVLSPSQQHLSLNQSNNRTPSLRISTITQQVQILADSQVNSPANTSPLQYSNSQTLNPSHGRLSVHELVPRPVKPSSRQRGTSNDGHNRFINNQSNNQSVNPQFSQTISSQPVGQSNNQPAMHMSRHSPSASVQRALSTPRNRPVPVANQSTHHSPGYSNISLRLSRSPSNEHPANQIVNHISHLPPISPSHNQSSADQPSNRSFTQLTIQTNNQTNNQSNNDLYVLPVNQSASSLQNPPDTLSRNRTSNQSSDRSSDQSADLDPSPSPSHVNQTTNQLNGNQSVDQFGSEIELPATTDLTRRQSVNQSVNQSTVYSANQSRLNRLPSASTAQQQVSTPSHNQSSLNQSFSHPVSQAINQSINHSKMGAVVGVPGADNKTIKTYSADRPRTMIYISFNQCLSIFTCVVYLVYFVEYSINQSSNQSVSEYLLLNLFRELLIAGWSLIFLTAISPSKKQLVKAQRKMNQTNNPTSPLTINPSPNQLPELELPSVLARTRSENPSLKQTINQTINQLKQNCRANDYRYGSEVSIIPSVVKMPNQSTNRSMNQSNNQSRTRTRGNSSDGQSSNDEDDDEMDEDEARTNALINQSTARSVNQSTNRSPALFVHNLINQPTSVTSSPAHRSLPHHVSPAQPLSLLEPAGCEFDPSNNQSINQSVNPSNMPSVNQSNRPLFAPMRVDSLVRSSPSTVMRSVTRSVTHPYNQQPIETSNDTSSHMARTSISQSINPVQPNGQINNFYPLTFVDRQRSRTELSPRTPGVSSRQQRIFQTSRG